MNLVDSCGWLEYLADGPNADFFAPAIEVVADLLVPTICIQEVLRRTLQQSDELSGRKAVAVMRQGRVVNLDLDTAVLAARLGVEFGLPLADSIILATARAHEATLWTQDVDFKGLEGVKYVEKG